MNKLILIGGGGHCRACIDVIERSGQYKIVGILDVPEKRGKLVLGYEVIGTDNDLINYIDKDYMFLITIGQMKSADRRKQIYNRLKNYGASLVTIVSPLAYFSSYADIGEGTIIMHGAYVNVGAKIGNNCIVNTKSNIEHDCVVGDHCHISTGAFVNGDCVIGEGVFIGSTAAISNQIRIEDNAVVGAGSMVIRNVGRNQIVVGVPAKKISS